MPRRHTPVCIRTQGSRPVSGGTRPGCRGMAAHPGDGPDLFHTMFGIASLAFLGDPSVASVDPRFCMPASVIGDPPSPTTRPDTVEVVS